VCKPEYLPTEGDGRIGFAEQMNINGLACFVIPSVMPKPIQVGSASSSRFIRLRRLREKAAAMHSLSL